MPPRVHVKQLGDNWVYRGCRSCSIVVILYQASTVTVAHTTSYIREISRTYVDPTPFRPKLLFRVRSIVFVLLHQSGHHWKERSQAHSHLQLDLPTTFSVMTGTDNAARTKRARPRGSLSTRRTLTWVCLPTHRLPTRNRNRC